MLIWDLFKTRYPCSVFPNKNHDDLINKDSYVILTFSVRMLFLKSFLLVAGADKKVDNEEIHALISWLRRPKCKLDLFAYAIQDFRHKQFQFLLSEKETSAIRKDSQTKLRWGLSHEITLDIRKYADKFRAQLKPTVTTEIELIHKQEKTFVNFGAIIDSEAKGKLNEPKCWMINIAPKDSMKNLVWRWDKHPIELIFKYKLNKESEEILIKEVGDVYRNLFSIGFPDHSGHYDQWIVMLKNSLCKFGLEHLPKDFANVFIEDIKIFMQFICDSFQEPENVKEKEKKKIKELIQNLKNAFTEINLMM